MNAGPVSETQEKPATASAFSYEPLEDDAKQIRLLEIVQQTSDCLEIRLSQYDVLSAPEYNAISYIWSDGGIIRMTDITVNGQVMHVTENCRYALEQAHSHYHQPPPIQSYFWIDSICINQNSDVEKQHQVAMMGRIYAEATRVLACVGRHEDNSEDLAKILGVERDFRPIYLESGPLLRYSNTFRIDQDWCNFRYYTTGAIYELLRFGRISESTAIRDLHVKLYKFSERYYWTRLWIIQQVASAEELEILCGSDKFTGSDMYRLHWIAGSQLPRVRNDYLHKREPNALYDHIDFPSFSHFIFVLDRKSKHKVPALEVLSFESPFGCSRPEDRVYGMLSQIQWPETDPPIHLEPIYKPSVNFDLAELFLSFPNCRHENVMGIFKALEICHDLDKIEELVAARSCTSKGPQNSSKPSIRQYDLEMRTCEVISENSTGQLTARLRCIDKDIDHSPTMLNMIENAPKLLYAESRIAAVLCSEARKGDLLAKTPFGESLFVLRHSGNSDEYDIVGQGLLLDRVGFHRYWSDSNPRQDLKMERDLRYRSFNHYLREHAWLLPKGFEIYELDLVLYSMYLKKLYEDERASQNHKDDLQLRNERLYIIDAALESIQVFLQLKWLNRDASSGHSQSHTDEPPMSVILALEPLELLLLGCQDLEKDGSRNQEKMIQRLNTTIHGKAFISYRSLFAST